MYIANYYVDLGDHVASPGDLIENDPNAKWHLKIGAIREATPDSVEITPVMENITPPEPEESAEAEGLIASVDGPEEIEDLPEEPDFEEPEAPEVDVTEALIAAPEADKPKKAQTRKSAAGAKGGKAK